MDSLAYMKIRTNLMPCNLDRFIWNLNLMTKKRFCLTKPLKPKGKGLDYDQLKPIFSLGNWLISNTGWRVCLKFSSFPN